MAAITACLVIPTISYWPALDAGFYFDDLQNIVEATPLHWGEITLNNIKHGIENAFMPRRIVANLSFALNYRVGDLNPKGFHLVNIFIHLATGLALSWVALMMALHRSRAKNNYLAEFITSLMISLLFLLHPLNTQAVTYIVQRMASMSTLFFLIAFGCYLYARNWATKPTKISVYILCTIFWLLSLGSKEIAFAFPIVTATYEFSFNRPNLVNHIRRKISDGTIWKWLIVIFLSLVIISVLLMSYAKPYLAWNNNFTGRDFNGYQRVLTQSRAHFFYLSLLLWPAPSRLNLDHHFPLSESLFNPWTTFPAILFWAFVFFLSVRLLRKHPGYGFPMLMYLVLHGIESGPINLELVFEHRMYLPMTALALLATSAVLDLRPTYRKFVWLLLGVLAFPLAFATYSRNETWSDFVALHYDTAQKSPNKFRPQYNLGTELGKLGRYGEALKALNRALEINPKDSNAHNQMGNCYSLMGLKAQALLEYEKAIELNPKHAEAVYNLATLYDRKKEYEKAKHYYHMFLLIAPPSLENYRKKVHMRLMILGSNRQSKIRAR